MNPIVTIEDLTTVSTNGTGAFDQLMQAVNGHLEQEFKKQRIKGAEYSNVYLGSMVAVLDQAVKFLAVQQQNAMIDAQIAKINAEIQLVEVQKANAVLEGLNLDKQGNLIDAQIAKIQAEIPKTQAEIALMGKQGLKIDADIVYQTKQSQLIDKQIAKLTSDIALTNAQLPKLIAETALTEEQVLKLKAEVIYTNKLLDKIDAEIGILEAKVISEQAQISDTVNGLPVTGIIGAQRNLYQGQTEGYKRDAEQKAAKIFADLYSVQRGTDEAYPPYAGFDALATNTVMDKLRIGINAV